MPSQQSHTFCEKVLEDHRELNSLLDRVQTRLSADPLSLTATATLLAELRDHVKEHFADEEAGGYFSEALTVAPWLRERAEALHLQHPLMIKSLETLLQHCRQGDDSPVWRKSMAAEFAAFHQHLRRHESGENQMIQDAYTQDMGASD